MREEKAGSTEKRIRTVVKEFALWGGALTALLTVYRLLRIIFPELPAVG